MKLTSSSENSSCSKSTNDRVPWIFLLPKVHQGAVNCGEHPSPNCKIASNDWSSFFYSNYATKSSPLETLKALNMTDEMLLCFHKSKQVKTYTGGVSETLDALEDTTSNTTHSEGTSTVIYNPPRAVIQN